VWCRCFHQSLALSLSLSQVGADGTRGMAAGAGRSSYVPAEVRLLSDAYLSLSDAKNVLGEC
jgi:hypothetical protein